MLGAQQARRNGVGAQQERWHDAGQQVGACVNGRGARGRARRRSGRAGAGVAAGERQVRGARGTAGRCSRRRRARGTRPGRGWARGLGARAGQDCALGALDLIFKPVFRLSIFPESVNEHCSM